MLGVRIALCSCPGKPPATVKLWTICHSQNCGCAHQCTGSPGNLSQLLKISLRALLPGSQLRPLAFSVGLMDLQLDSSFFPIQYPISNESLVSIITDPMVPIFLILLVSPSFFTFECQLAPGSSVPHAIPSSCPSLQLEEPLGRSLWRQSPSLDGKKKKTAPRE